MLRQFLHYVFFQKVQGMSSQLGVCDCQKLNEGSISMLVLSLH